HAGNRQVQSFGRQFVISQLQTDRRRFARPQRDRRIVAHQIEAFDILGRGVVGPGNRRKQSRDSGNGGDKLISHWHWLPCRKWFGSPARSMSTGEEFAIVGAIVTKSCRQRLVWQDQRSRDTPFSGSWLVS